MNYLSLCSGVEAATAAWHPLGWEAVAYSEIEKFPCEVLKHHYPQTPNYGDMTKFKEWPNESNVDVLVGGTPCQSFSVAGLRKGLDDPRGNLMLTYLAIAEKYRPDWLLWENVPGVLSSNGGKDFGALLGGMAELGYGFAYRVLDAQYFGVAQRRRRVFVVGCLGGWQRAAAVLFEQESLSGHPAPSREKGEEIASFTASSIAGYSEGVGTLRANGGDIGGGSENLIAKCLTTKTRVDAETETLIPTYGIPATAYNITFCDANGTRKDRPNGGLYVSKTDVSNTLTRAGVETNVVDNVCTPTLTSNGDAHSGFRDEKGLVKHDMAVRRLTPTECERLQGFPDGYTKINEKTADGPRYKALGNSMAVPCMAWLGKRIEMASGINA